MSVIVTMLSSILGLVRTTVGGLTDLWIFGVAVGFAVIGLATTFIASLLNKRRGRRR